MITIPISIGTRFSWNRGFYEVKRLLPNWHFNIEELTTGAIQIIDRQQLFDAWNAGNLRLAIEEHFSSPIPQKTEFELSDFDDKLVAKARFRLWVIQPLLTLSLSERTTDLIDKRILEAIAEAENNPIKAGYFLSLSRRTVLRWIREYNKSGNDLRIFIDKYRRCGGRHKSRLNKALLNLMDSVINEFYLKQETETIDDVLHEIVVRIEEENHVRSLDDQLTKPARSTIARRIDALDMRAKFAAKHGKRAADREFNQAGQLHRPEMPLERVEIDDTWSDAIVLDEEDWLPLGRPCFCYCLDVATAYPLGYYLGFEPPSYYAVMECLYHAICPKPNVRELYETDHDWITQGIPKNLVIDNGKQYVGKDLEDACATLGITLIYSPVATPSFKPYVERTFGSYNWLFHKTPGTSFSNIVQRGDYESARRAVITLPDLIKALNIYTVDVYAEKRNSGLGGIPARRWEEAMNSGFPLRLPASKDDLRVLLGRVDYRTIQHYGIDFKHIRYNASELSELRHHLKGKQVKIKFHPGDLSRIYVCDPFEEVYLEIPALDQEYTQGLSLWKHRVIRDLANQEEEKVDMAALGRAKRKIRQIFKDAVARKKSGNRKQMARWDGGGEPPSLADQLPQPTQPNISPSSPSTFLLPAPDDTCIDQTSNESGQQRDLAYLPK